MKDIKLKLVGPFDILAGKVSEVYEEDLPDFLRHWRFYYDPPEFQVGLILESNLTRKNRSCRNPFGSLANLNYGQIGKVYFGTDKIGFTTCAQGSKILVQ